MKAALFDLDNTLYPETDFVRSGFSAVAEWLATRFAADSARSLGLMLDAMQRDGRGRVFDTTLTQLGLGARVPVELLLHVYRTHEPMISLAPEVRSMLERLRSEGVALGLVTDGASCVQHAKVAALGLGDLFEAIVCTDDLGPGHGKPSLVPFQIALGLLGCEPGESAYVADDARKDFIAPNALGMCSVRVSQFLAGSFVPTVLITDIEPAGRPQHEVDRVCDLEALIVEKAEVGQ